MNYKMVSRENDCKTMIELIRNSKEYKEISKNGLVILLNGSWGSGKTTFIEELKKTINEEEDLECFFHYNSYEFDYYDNAYVPFFASLNSKIEFEKKHLETINNIGNEAKKGLVSIGYNLICKYIENKYDIDLKNLKDTMQELEEEEQSKNVIDHFENVKSLKKYIANELETISKDKKNIFIIDELDRCKPVFAMDTLEIVKHFFDLENCIFIIAVDKMQLEESMKSIYGVGVDGEKYFSKLFDYQFNLLPIPFTRVVNTSSSFVLGIINSTIMFFEYLNISTRDSKKIYNELCKRAELLGGHNEGVFLTFMLILKYTDLSFYNELFNLSYNEWKERFKNPEDIRLSKYKKVLELKIDNYTFGQVLEEVVCFINYNFIDLNRNTNGNLIEFSNFTKVDRKTYGEIISFVNCKLASKTVGENIKMMVG